MLAKYRKTRNKRRTSRKSRRASKRSHRGGRRCFCRKSRKDRKQHGGSWKLGELPADAIVYGSGEDDQAPRMMSYGAYKDLVEEDPRA